MSWGRSSGEGPSELCSVLYHRLQVPPLHLPTIWHKEIRTLPSNCLIVICLYYLKYKLSCLVDIKDCESGFSWIRSHKTVCHHLCKKQEKVHMHTHEYIHALIFTHMCCHRQQRMPLILLLSKCVPSCNATLHFFPPWCGVYFSIPWSWTWPYEVH